MATVIPPATGRGANWIPIAGEWHISEDAKEYRGAKKDTQFPFGVALSNTRFRGGSCEFTVEFHTDKVDCAAGLALGFTNISANYYQVTLGGFDFAYSLGEYLTNFGWRPLTGVGEISNLRGRQPYHCEVSLAGQRVTLSVDGVRVLDHVLHAPVPGMQLGLYTFGQQHVRFSDIIVNPRPPRVFVAMQFSEPYDTFYRNVIGPIGAEFDVEIVRIDEITGPGIIFQDIQKEIAEAEIIVAEITAPNENVFYELGYAHALNKPTILLAQRGKQLPFDIRSYRVIFYDDSIGGKSVVEEQLRKHFRSILESF